MRKVIIVVEGKTDELILKAILPKELENKVQFVVGSGRYSAQSIARTILAYERQPVALVFDADTTDESKIKEQLTYSQKALGEVASDIPYKAFIVVPEIEILFFESEVLLEKLAHRNLSLEESGYAKTMPRKILEKLLGGDYRSRLPKILKQLDEPAIKKLQSTPLIKDLCSFLYLASSVLEQDAVAA